MRSRDYGISERARKQCQTLGLSPETAESYARQAAPFTAPGFNRRYEGFVMRVDRRTIEEIGLYQENSPRTRLSDAADSPEHLLLGRCHALMESVAEGWYDQYDDDSLLAGLEDLIDELEPFRSSERADPPKN